MTTAKKAASKASATKKTAAKKPAAKKPAVAKTAAAKKPAAKKVVAKKEVADKKPGAHLTARATPRPITVPEVAAEYATEVIKEIGLDGNPLLTIGELQFLVVDALEDVKAQHINVFDTTGLSDLFERVVICTATSNRQTRSLANSVREKVKAAGHGYVTSEGEETGEWVLVDLGDIVVHIMQAPIREYYRLEEIWGAKPVDIAKPVKKAPAKRSTAKKSSEAIAKPKAPAKKAAAKKAKA